MEVSAHLVGEGRKEEEGGGGRGGVEDEDG